MRVGRYVFQPATTDDQIEQIQRLYYRTFVDEIPQYAPSATGTLVDKFHHKNCYFVALVGGRVVGSISVHDQPPFSVADRLSDPTMLEQPGRRPMEVRLLAVEPEVRGSNVLWGLLWMCTQHARDSGYTDLYISGVVERVEMYRRIGFEPLGPPVPCGETAFVPMRVSFPLDAKVERLIQLWMGRLKRLSAE